MATANSVCVFCKSKKGTLIIFKKHTLNKCTEILKIKKKHNLSGKDTNLPKSLNDFCGYHSYCYRNFTALGKKYRHLLSSSSASASLPEPSVSGINEDIDVPEKDTCDVLEILSDAPEEAHSQVEVDAEIFSEGSAKEKTVFKDEFQEKNAKIICIFCNKKRKKHRGYWQNIHSLIKKSTIEKIQSNAIKLNDVDLIKRIENLVSQKKQIFYHNICKKSYDAKCKSHISQYEKSMWHNKRHMHNIAYQEICSFITDNVINNRHCYFYNFLQKLYTDRVRIQYKKVEETSSEIISARHLEKKLLKTFAKKISVVTMNNKKIVKPYRGVILQNDFIKLEKDIIVYKAA